MMAALHRSSDPEKLMAAALPGWRVLQLKGRLGGHWRLSVTGNWRLIARFDAGDVFDLDLVDDH